LLFLLMKIGACWILILILHPDPDPANNFWYDRIRIHNTACRYLPTGTKTLKIYH